MLLERIGALSPGIDVGLVDLMPRPRDRQTCHSWAQCLDPIEQREVDVALLPVRDVPHRFEAHRLYDEDFVVAMRRGHAFARNPSEAKFCAAGHLLVSSGGDPHGFVDEVLASRGRTRRVALTVPSFMKALEHIAQSELLATLPRRLVQRQVIRFGLTAVELPFRRKADAIQAVTTKAAMRDAGVAWLVEPLVSLFAARHSDPPGR